ncbi:hypothetical protein [Microbacterium lacus]|uniref:Phospholipase/carboxylesterase/thioesterase domain-containing protein n=1 Tax=Microbacterium lacus TaxID=415217 RepID=A0ABN2FXR4_9MICO
MAATKRQAVIVIHGIGEQLPMETLRDFAGSFLDGELLYNKPDRLSEGTDQRRLVMPRTRHRRATDFYELYWANKFDEGRVAAVWFWLLGHVINLKRHHHRQMRVLVVWARSQRRDRRGRRMARGVWRRRRLLRRVG